MESCPIAGTIRVFLCDSSGTDENTRGYGNNKEAELICERKPDGNKSIWEDTSLTDKTDDPVVLPYALVLSSTPNGRW